MSNNNTHKQLLNLANIQTKLDEIVFENIDTGHKWEHAQSMLQELLNQCDEFFAAYIQRNEGQLPKENSYWALFMDLVAKITYFIGYTEQQRGADSSYLANKYENAAKFLPNCDHEGCVEFYEEIRNSYQSVANEQLLKQKYSILEAVQNYAAALEAAK